MSEPIISRYITVDEYLESEEQANARHEYVRGRVFAMAGATDAHNTICGNLFSAVHTFLRGSSCTVYANEMKVNVEILDSFYYPDIMVTCEPFNASSVFKSNPRLIIEVQSPSTKHVDRREKLVAYQALPSLQQYVMVAQNRYWIESQHRLSEMDWGSTILRSPEEKLNLDALAGRTLIVSLKQIYERLSLPLRVEEEDAEYELA